MLRAASTILGLFGLLIAPALAEGIQAVVQERYPLLQLHLLTERPALHALGKYQEDADRFVFESDAFCRELGDRAEPVDAIAEDHPAQLAGGQVAQVIDSSRNAAIRPCRRCTPRTGAGTWWRKFAPTACRPLIRC